MVTRENEQLSETELMERWATVTDLAELYSMSPTAVRSRAKSGEWPCHRLGHRTIRFSPEDQRDIRDMWKSNQSDLQEKKREALQRKRIKALLEDL